MDLQELTQSIRYLGLNFQNLDIENSKDYCLFLHKQLTEEGICNIRFHKAIENIINNEIKLYNLPSKALIKEYLPEQELIEYKEKPYLLREVKVDGETILCYKKEMVDCFKRFLTTAAGQYAKENSFLGYFYENGNYTGGLIEYIANILLFQVKVLTQREGFNFNYPQSNIEGFTKENEVDFRRWLESDDNINNIMSGGKLDESLNRRDDLFIIAKYYKNKYS